MVTKYLDFNDLKHCADVGLIKIFKPASIYKNARIAYWASKQWQPEALENFYISQELQYKVGDKERKLIVFKNH